MFPNKEEPWSDKTEREISKISLSSKPSEGKRNFDYTVLSKLRRRETLQLPSDPPGLLLTSLLEILLSYYLVIERGEREGGRREKGKGKGRGETDKK